MIIEVDRRIYSDACISKTVYAFLDRYAVSRHMKTDNVEIVEMCPKSDAAAPNEMVFTDCLNDNKLREIVNTETKELRTVLYAKAFGDLDEFEDEI